MELHILIPATERRQPTGKIWGFAVIHFQFDSSNVSYHAAQLEVALRIDNFELNKLLIFYQSDTGCRKY